MSPTLNPTAPGGIGIVGVRTPLCGSPVECFATGHDTINARGRAAAQGSGS